MRVDLAKEAPGALSAAGGDFVRIMTVHASKGLEFPIVAVAELRNDSAHSQALACCSVAGHTYVSLDGGRGIDHLREKTSSLVAKSGAYQPFSEFDEDELAEMVTRAATPADRRAAIKLHEERGEAAEARRLLYVALTRAKEALVISMRGKASKADATGLSKGCWGDVQSAFVGVGNVFEPGVSVFDFGGQRPARVECVQVSPADVDALLGREKTPAGDGTAGNGGAACNATAAEVAGIPAGEGTAVACVDVPVVPPYTPQRGKPYAHVRAGVFSYSSIAQEHDAFAGLVVEGGADEAAAARISAADADAATDLGTAFHRLAQVAVLNWQPGCALERPSAARQQALERSCALSAAQCERLNAALGRWFASDVAARVAACSCVRAEVPFFLQLGTAAQSAYMEGEIDVLAESGMPGTVDSPTGAALVVDYKTGGSPAETPEQLHEKHLLQATCYAYAVLLQGYAQVECVFVRVEQGRADAPDEPQTVQYRFSAADAPAMRQAIAQAYELSKQR